MLDIVMEYATLPLKSNKRTKVMISYDNYYGDIEFMDMSEDEIYQVLDYFEQ